MHREPGYFMSDNPDGSGELGEFKRLYESQTEPGVFFHDSNRTDRSHIPDSSMYTRTTFRANSYGGEMGMKVRKRGFKEPRKEKSANSDFIADNNFHGRGRAVPTANRAKPCSSGTEPRPGIHAARAVEPLLLAACTGTGGLELEEKLEEEEELDEELKEEQEVEVTGMKSLLRCKLIKDEGKKHDYI